MKALMQTIAILGTFLFGCKQSSRSTNPLSNKPSVHLISYPQLKDSINEKRKAFSSKYKSDKSLQETGMREITNFWVGLFCNDLCDQWQGTPWDFNGTSSTPKQGTIACGYFVTNVLSDIGVKINRTKLATCPSSVMMHTLVPGQKIRNLSSLTHDDFNRAITKMGKGVYIIGLDFHTGFILNDGSSNWFFHSSYVNKKGVVKERLQDAVALRSSKTRWLVCLTSDSDFMNR